MMRRTTCAHCRQKFVAERPSQIVHADCAVPWAIAQAAKRERVAEKEARAAAKVERAETKRRKEAVKGRGELIAEAQKAFNAFIRARDAGQPCICCGKPFQPDRPGGSVDAGHFRSRGSAPHLRFTEDNCFAQRKNCNRPGGATHDAFRAGVLARIGPERLAAVECDQTSPKWSHDDLRAIRATYAAKARELKRIQGETA